MVTSWNLPKTLSFTSLPGPKCIISPSWMCLLDIKSLQWSAGFLQELLCLALLHDDRLELLKDSPDCQRHEGQGHNFPLLFPLHQASLSLENMTNLERFKTRINSHLIQEEKQHLSKLFLPKLYKHMYLAVQVNQTKWLVFWMIHAKGFLRYIRAQFWTSSVFVYAL